MPKLAPGSELRQMSVSGFNGTIFWSIRPQRPRDKMPRSPNAPGGGPFARSADRPKRCYTHPPKDASGLVSQGEFRLPQLPMALWTLI